MSYLYSTIEEYEGILGQKVNDAFRIGWGMARSKSEQGEEKPGKVHKDAMFLRNYIGELKADDGRLWELCTNFGSGNPIIQSKQTGKSYTIEWQELLALAIDAGIEEE